MLTPSVLPFVAVKSGFCSLFDRRLGVVLAWLGLAILSFPCRSLAAPTLFLQADPTDEEQDLLQKLNRARMDPAGEGQRLADWLRNTSDGQAVVRQYGPNPDQVGSDFASLPAVPPLAFDPHLLAASRAHATDLATHGGGGPSGDDHAGYDGSSPEGRVAASGFTSGFAGENVISGAASTDEIHAGYPVDWGNPGLGHRINSMAASSAFVGVGLASMVGAQSLAETEDFGHPRYLMTPDTVAMLTGVVYHDANGNGQYDPGEGIAGVVVSVDGGGYYAVTSASGGYSLPLLAAGDAELAGSVTARVKYQDGGGTSKSFSLTGHSKFGVNYWNNVEWEVQTGVSNALPALFNGAAALSGGWSYLSFPNGNYFGYYHAGAFPSIFHDDLGWEYVVDAGDGQEGMYLYDFQSGAWWYTSPSFGFPYLYDFSRGTVLYYYPDGGKPGHYTSAPRWFFDFASSQIVTR